MARSAFYNDTDRYCCDWISNLMDAGLVTPGVIDDRSIVDVTADDVRGFQRVHFFAGLAGWERALQLAGWGDEPVWTGSCPCQPFSVAGKRLGKADSRHLWPDFFRIIQAGRPAVVMGEQVAGAAGYGWFDGVAADLEREAYACGAVDIPAAAVNAPHIRQRLYWVADTGRAGQAASGLGDPEYAERGQGLQGRLYQPDGAAAGRDQGASQLGTSVESPWGDWGLVGPDPAGKWRRVKPGVRLLASGVPARVPKLRAFGNAIVPPLAAEVIRTYMETRR